MLDSLTSAAYALSPGVSQLWPDEGKRWIAEPRKHAPGLDSLLSWAYRLGSSRISFQTGRSEERRGGKEC